MGKDRADHSLGITAVSIRGFKSHVTENRIDIRQLTILAGANSSGKSSMIQPLLLMKQTLEAPYDDGPLFLDGPNTRFTSVDQLLSRLSSNGSEQGFAVGIETHGAWNLRMEYFYSPNQELGVRSMSIARAGSEGKPLIRLTPDDDSVMLEERLSAFVASMNMEPLRGYELFKFAAIRDRCFLALVARMAVGEELGTSQVHLTQLLAYVPHFELIRMIHVPGLRGNPERSYSRTALRTIDGIGFARPLRLQLFPGTFERYVATVIAGWQSSGDSRLDDLQMMLRELGLGQEVAAEPVDDTRIELRLGSLSEVPRRDSQLISIADVGFGVSQVLPVLVALLVADSGQVVYVEQPELHLHPRAQCALARFLADAARRGVRLVVETHSALLLLSVRTLVADGELDPELVKLHWFSLSREDGSTRVSSADLDQDGAYGDWPEDFADVELAAEGVYLDAVEHRNGT